MVDKDAQRGGISESEAVRDAVRFALAGQEIVAALQGLHDSGAFADFEQFFPPLSNELSAD